MQLTTPSVCICKPSPSCSSFTQYGSPRGKKFAKVLEESGKDIVLHCISGWQPSIIDDVHLGSDSVTLCSASFSQGGLTPLVGSFWTAMYMLEEMDPDFREV